MGKKKESKLVKYLLIGISILFLFVMLVLPLFVVVTEALKKGWQVYVEAVTDSFTIAALMLTLKATVIAVLCNTVLGLCAAWAVTRFQFKGKKFLTTLIDVPVTVSPIIAGLIYLLVFGKQSILYPYLQKANIQIVFAVPGIILATVFVTFPFVFRELLPVLESIGTDEEEAAGTYGSKRMDDFFKNNISTYQMGAVVWNRTLYCKSHGGIWRSICTVRSSQGTDEYIAAACRNFI